MTAAAPWSVKGIDPKAREIAKDLARRSGMTLGEWLNQMIFEDGESAPSRVVALTRPGAEPGSRTGEGLQQVLAALEDLTGRFDASLKEQADTSARFEAALADLKQDQAKVAERVQAVEHNGGGGGGRAEALRALEGALNKVAAHLNAGESRQREAMAQLRSELGDEMHRVADQMNRKVLEVENRSADAIAQMGVEVGRVALSVEQRLRRADEAQAEALERLGGEIARITERLSERIAAAERRAAQSVEGVGEQISRVTDRLHQRQERSESELALRISQSEERTARLLEEARAAIERGLARRDARPEPEAPAPVRPEPAVAAALAENAPAAEPAVDLYTDLRAELEASHDRQAPLEADDEHDLFEARADAAHDVQDSVFVAPPPLLTQGRPAPEALAEETPFTLEDGGTLATEHLFQDDEEAPPAAEPEPLAADEAAAARHDESTAAHAKDSTGTAPVAAAAPTSFTPLGDHVEPDSALSAFLPAKPRKPASMRGVLFTGGAMAFTALAATGYAALHPDLLASHAPKAPLADKPIPVGPASNPAPAPAQPASPQAAVALATQPAPKDDEASAAAVYRDALAKVDANDPSGVAPLKTAASLGYAPAQRRLGKLYEDGGAGVAKDLAEGRNWTQRAAANGDPRGMHNLGLDYYEGSGGLRNPAIAAQWFQRAADLGLRDSQFNLARFYEAGIGVRKDLAVAYRWYLIAGRAGDAEAVQRGEALKAQLPPDALAKAEQAAAFFRPDPAAPPASMTASLKGSSPKQLALAQQALKKLGYYKGIEDGAASQALGEAIQAYQRDRGLAGNGQLSPELVQAFAHIVQ